MTGRRWGHAKDVYQYSGPEAGSSVASEGVGPGVWKVGKVKKKRGPKARSGRRETAGKRGPAAEPSTADSSAVTSVNGQQLHDLEFSIFHLFLCWILSTFSFSFLCFYRVFGKILLRAKYTWTSEKKISIIDFYARDKFYTYFKINTPSVTKNQTVLVSFGFL